MSFAKKRGRCGSRSILIFFTTCFASLSCKAGLAIRALVAMSSHVPIVVCAFGNLGRGCSKLRGDGCTHRHTACSSRERSGPDPPALNTSAKARKPRRCCRGCRSGTKRGGSWSVDICCRTQCAQSPERWLRSDCSMVFRIAATVGTIAGLLAANAIPGAHGIRGERKEVETDPRRQGHRRLRVPCGDVNVLFARQ